MRKYSKDLNSDELRTYIIQVSIRGKDRGHAEKIVGYAFDNMMSFEDKQVFQPKVLAV